MRTKHTYLCAVCGKQDFKDWPYRPDRDDDDGTCQACFDAHCEVMGYRGNLALVRSRATGERVVIPATFVTKQ